MTDTRIVLVDDHPPIREGIAAVIGRSETFVVADSVGSYEEGLRSVRREQPDAVVIDISLPDGNGLDLIRKISGQFPDTRIMVLTMHARKKLADRAFEAGAHGYLLKESTGEFLLEGLRRILQGEFVVDPHLASETPVGGRLEATSPESTLAAKLTPRELEVFRLLAVGKTGKQIAAILGISPKTVDNHRANVMRKLQAHSVAALVRIAIRIGIIDP